MKFHQIITISWTGSLHSSYKGRLLARHLKRRHWSLTPHYYLKQQHSCSCLFLLIYSCYPWTGLYILWGKFGLRRNLLPTDFWCILLSPFYFDRPYLRSILYTRNSVSHTCILNSRVGRKSSSYFSPWDIPWIVLHLCVVGCSPAYECGRGKLLPL